MDQSHTLRLYKLQNDMRKWMKTDWMKADWRFVLVINWLISRSKRNWFTLQSLSLYIFLPFQCTELCFNHRLQKKNWAIVLISQALTMGVYIRWGTYSRGFNYWLIFEIAFYTSRFIANKKNFSKHKFCISTRQISGFQNGLLERVRL